MNKRNIISAIIAILLITWIAIYAHQHWDEFQKVQLISGQYVFILLALTLLNLIIQGLILKTSVSPFNIKLSWVEWFGLKITQLTGNYVVPFGGLGLRVFYLKKVHNLEYTKNITTISVVVLVEFLIFSIGGLISLMYLFSKYGTVDIILMSFLGLLIAIISTIMLSGQFSLKFETTLISKINKVIQSWYLMKSDRQFLREIFIITAIEFVSFALIYYFAFKAFHLTIPFLSSFLITCLSDFSFFFRIAPAALGSYEASVIYSAKVYGFTVVDGLIIVGIIRLLNMCFYFSLSPIFSYILTKKIGGREKLASES